MIEKKFINLLKKTKEEYSFRVYLFVLMTNHVHFVIYDENDRMSKIMHKLCSSYAKYLIRNIIESDIYFKIDIEVLV